MRFRSKPVATTYVEAIFDDHTKSVHYHPVDKAGKSLGAVETTGQEDFAAQYDAVVRKPRTSKPVTA